MSSQDESIALRSSGTEFSAKGRCRPLFQIWGRSRTKNSSKGLNFLVGHPVLFNYTFVCSLSRSSMSSLAMILASTHIQVKPLADCKMATMYVLVWGADLRLLHLHQIKPTAHLSRHGRLQPGSVLSADAHQWQVRRLIRRVPNWNFG